LTLEQMEYFAKVYRQRSITQAAEQLHITRQALSLVVKKIEDEFGTALFVRQNNGVLPTEAADILYQNVSTILVNYATLKQAMAALHTEPALLQNIKIGITEVIATIYGDELAEALQSAFPNMHFVFILVNSIADPAAYQNFDLLFTPFKSTNEPNIALTEEYDFYRVLTQKSYVWISADSPLCSLPIITPEDLKTYRHLIFNNIFDRDTVSRFFPSIEIPYIKLKSSFIDYIENYNCFASDSKIDHGKLIYEDIFKGRNVVLKESSVIGQLNMICKKSLENILPIIFSIIR